MVNSPATRVVVHLRVGKKGLCSLDLLSQSSQSGHSLTEEMETCQPDEFLFDK